LKEAMELLFEKPAFATLLSGIGLLVFSRATHPFLKSWTLGVDINYVPRLVKSARKLGLRS